MNPNNFFRKILLSFVIVISFTGLFAQVSISPNLAKADTSAMLDVSSTKKGILIPRLALIDLGDKETIPEPANSLLVYNTNEDVIKFPFGPGYYCNTGNPGKANWVKLLSEGDPFAWLVNGNDNVSNANFIGTTDEQDVIFKSNSIEAFRIGKGATLLAGNYSDVIDDVVPATGPGTRLMWLPARHAFRGGIANNTEWDLANIGIGSFAYGNNVKASKQYTIAMGYVATASEQYAIAMGFGPTASGANAIAIGAGATASKLHSIALGSNAFADGTSSLAIGSNQALKISAVALGNGTKANGNSSMTIGEGTIANALGSFAIGRYNVDAPANAATTALTDKVFQIGDGTAPGLRKDILYVTRNGNMNITGCFTATNVMCPSDLRLKENIFPLENVFDKINNIQPITYYFKDKTNYPATHQIGFSAQEIEKEFPELVNKNEQGFLSVNYPQMSVVAIQAIKEQQQIINHQQNEITTLQKEVEELKIQMQKVMRNKF